MSILLNRSGDKRSYKNAWDAEDAKQEILKGRGTQFDPEVVDAFERG